MRQALTLICLHGCQAFGLCRLDASDEAANLPLTFSTSVANGVAGQHSNGPGTLSRIQGEAVDLARDTLAHAHNSTIAHAVVRTVIVTGRLDRRFTTRHEQEREGETDELQQANFLYGR